MTRYPKSGKGSKWTIKELNAVGAEWKGDTLSDSEGLSGDVRFTDSASINFRYAFKWGGKVAWHYCGSYPRTDMAAIREERDNARKLVKKGIDPRASKIEAQAEVVATIKADEQQ